MADDDARVFSILVVCTANICRSPLAEHLLRRALAEAPGNQPEFEVVSAGILGWVHAPMDPLAAAELRRLGGDPGEFRSQSFRAVDAIAVDLVLTATLEQRAAVLQEVPEVLRRTFTLLEMANLVSEVPQVHGLVGAPRELVRQAAAYRGTANLALYDVPDPYGHGPRAHRATADLIHRACLLVAAALTGHFAGIDPAGPARS